MITQDVMTLIKVVVKVLRFIADLLEQVFGPFDVRLDDTKR